MNDEEYDVIVVGAGVEGSGCAYTLVKAGQRTLLLEQFPLPHSRGSSSGHSRITRFAYRDDFYIPMMLDVYAAWEKLASEVWVKLFKQCGMLEVDRHQGDYLDSISTAMSRYGMRFQRLSPRELQSSFPMLRFPPSYGGLFDPQAGVLNSGKAVPAFHEVFKRNGGVLRDAEPVSAVTPGETFVTVTTTKGQYRAKKVVLATGPWTSKMLAPLGLKLPLRVLRGTVMFWRETKPGTYSSDNFPTFFDGETRIYALPSDEYPGYVKLSVSDGCDVDPDARDTVDDLWIRDKVSRYIRQHFPLLADTPAILETCIYTVRSPDWHPVIDFHPVHKNVIIAAGFSGQGFKLAPAVGKAVTEMVLGNPPSYEMSHFAVSRFLPPSSNL